MGGSALTFVYTYIVVQFSFKSTSKNSFYDHSDYYIVCRDEKLRCTTHEHHLRNEIWFLGLFLWVSVNEFLYVIYERTINQSIFPYCVSGIRTLVQCIRNRRRWEHLHIHSVVYGWYWEHSKILVRMYTLCFEHWKSI